MFSRGHRPTEAIRQREEPVDEAKPFDIPKREVWEAFKRVKANQGAAGVDGQSLQDFEVRLAEQDGNILAHMQPVAGKEGEDYQMACAAEPEALINARGLLEKDGLDVLVCSEGANELDQRRSSRLEMCNNFPHFRFMRRRSWKHFLGRRRL